MKKVIANKEIDVNEEGYLSDFSQWDKTVAEGIAQECEIPLKW
jgi:tRNA 2-thiouridine synthesizing protein E